MNGLPKITCLYAFIALDQDGTEGVPAMNSRNGPLPLIVSDPDLADKLKPTAADLAEQRGIKITLCKFSHREELEEFLP